MVSMPRPGSSCAFIIAIVSALGLGLSGSSQARQSLTIRGHAQSLFVYGSPQAPAVIVSSGDGGWIHLGPHVAEFLAARGFFVVGFDVRGYLESFTSRRSTLRPEDEPRDYEVLAEFAREKTGSKPVLIGISEGAGLSVLAATDTRTKARLGGVVALGLPDLNELGWRWKDAVIYLTHRVPDEPTFSAAAIVARVAPLPLAAIQSTHDEFVPPAEARRILNAAGDPKHFWFVPAADHRFSDNLEELDRRLIEALAWVRENSPR